ncbi:MAG: hypothetical protein HDS16_05315 [Bacteroides sp.]|nr:hypothetical protein [Bacteroides sp.]
MQTIKVTSTRNEYQDVIFAIDGSEIATVSRDVWNPGKYRARFGIHRFINNARFVDAVEYISDAICNHFAAFGLNVEFN